MPDSPPSSPSASPDAPPPAKPGNAVWMAGLAGVVIILLLLFPVVI